MAFDTPQSDLPDVVDDEATQPAAGAYGYGATNAPFEADDGDDADETDETDPDEAEDDGDDEPGDEDPATGTTATGARRRAAGAGRTVSRGLLRRVAAKALALAAADEDDRAPLAVLLGTTTDPTEMTVAIFTTARTAAAPVGDLLSVADADPMEAGIAVLSMDKPRVRAMWALAESLGVLSVAMPASDSKAALALAKAAQSISDTQRERLSLVADMARRTAA